MTSIRSRTHFGPVLVLIATVAGSAWLLAPASAQKVLTRLAPAAAPSKPLDVGASVAPTPKPVISGRASVIDGDTLEIAGQRIRLFGIDAPEASQQCVSGTEAHFPVGRRSANALDAYINDRPVNCEVVDIDRYKRNVAQCFIGDVDLNSHQVASGWAYAFRRYSEAYTSEEFAAAGMELGLWSCDYLMRPWDYRKQKNSL